MSTEAHLCPHCWREIPAEAQLCPHCGRSTNERLRKAEQELVQDKARRRFVREVADRLAGGQHVAVLASRGSGKTTLAACVHRELLRRAVPCGLSPWTSSLSEVTAALDRAYGGVAAGAPSQRHARARLRLEAERAPAVLLLDHVQDVPMALRGFLRSLRGGAAGVAYFVDIDFDREHARMRSWHLGHTELWVPPLGRAALRQLLAPAAGAFAARDLSRLVRDARGRPGFAVRCVELARRDAYWREGRLLRQVLASDVDLALYLGNHAMGGGATP